ncbi:MAG: ABC transporter transmembrane domain-containing protein [Pseudomonadota bacterium]
MAKAEETAPKAGPAGGTKTEERAKSRKLSPLKGLLPFLRPYRARIILVSLALVSAAAFTLAVPVAFGRVIDVIDAKEFALIDEYFLSLIAVAAALAAATALRFYLVSWLGERVVADVRRAVFSHVVTMSPGFYEKVMTTEVVTRLTADTTVIQSVVGSTVSIALRNTLLLIGGIIALLVTSPKLTLMTLLIVPTVVFPILFLGRKVRKLSRLSQDKLADAASHANEMLQAAQTVQANTYEGVAKDVFAGRVESAFQAARDRLVARSWLTVLVIFFVFAGVVGVIWIGARDVISGTMTPGDMAQFVLFAVFTAGAVGALSEVWGELQRAAGATERLAELLAMTSPVEDLGENLGDAGVPAAAGAVTPMARGRGEIVFEEVRFAYPARPGIAAMDGVSFRAAPGETLALVGPSGAGKTTALQLLMRFYDPDGGRILLDGVPVRDMSLTALRRQIAVVPQEPVIFADSVRANIRFGRPEATDAEIEAAAEAAAAAGFIEALPEGYESWLGERGVLLSGGQKQRIAIARAILRDAPVLLLDEATSALDAESERAVQAAVERLSAGRTTLAIAHRLATVKRADRILVLEDGRLIDQGTHDDLVARDGLYARLARLQFTEGLAAE